MKPFEVDIIETYPGSQHCVVRIFINGYGSPRPEFRLIGITDLEIWPDVALYLNECNGGTFRPEYAKAIKRGLEEVSI